MFGEGALATTISFSEAVTDKYEVRVYSSYIAVQWDPAPNADIESVTDQVVAIGLRTLGQRFGWGENLVVEYFDGLDELMALRRRENPGGLRWILGVG